MISMPKLKWKLCELLDDLDGPAVAFGFIIIAFVTFLAMAFIQGVIFGTPGPDALTAIVPVVAAILFVAMRLVLPRFHYLSDVDDYDSERALEWYYSLTKTERKQLPDGWDNLIYDKGSEYYSGRRYNTVAAAMHAEGREVINLYNQKNAVPKVEDYRIEMYMNLMKERQDDLAQDISVRKEIEKKIASMP